ncbi:phage tail protein [Luteolibacter yonseiensis]|uniref:Phage tail protein n=1 Tax=Luteolibacter yonseiensis TaxID=1144680 RepID=A0A934V976_9BACT|nr:tail fiber protein [Luteolibacter yonseiensis]MBK1818032.1 phage tail protein [Luteolibacter yonseiensis]
MATPFIAQIATFGFNFAPRGWAQCNGQTLPIAQNTALFSILGTTYGGNGTTTFMLPNLQGRAPMHPGAGGGLTSRTLGQVLGTENQTLSVPEMPAHNHGGVVAPMSASPAAGGSSSPSGMVPAVTPRPLYADTGNGSLGAPSISSVGGGQPHLNMQPYLCVNFCIALQGIFPSRN